MNKKYNIGDRFLIYGKYEFLITNVYDNYVEGIYVYSGLFDKFFKEELDIYIKV